MKKIVGEKEAQRVVPMTHRYHLVKKKVGVEGPLIPFSKILNKSHGNPFLLSKIEGALNPHFFLHPMVPVILWVIGTTL